MRIIAALVIFLAIGYSCTEAPIPKKRGYIRMDFPAHAYARAEPDCPFSFDVSRHAELQKTADSCHYRLWYPQLKGEVFLDYLPLNEENSLRELLDEMHRLAYQHEVKASAINTRATQVDSLDKFILEYKLGGNVASAYQFCITDSSKHFLRGALYFRTTPNRDSLNPALGYLEKDLDHLLASFRWN